MDNNNNIRTFETTDYTQQSIIGGVGNVGLGGPQRRTHRVTTPKDNF